MTTIRVSVKLCVHTMSDSTYTYRPHTQTFCISLSMHCGNTMSNFYRWTSRCGQPFYPMSSIKRWLDSPKISRNTCCWLPQLHRLDIWLINNKWCQCSLILTWEGYLISSPVIMHCCNRVTNNVQQQQKKTSNSMDLCFPSLSLFCWGWRYDGMSLSKTWIQYMWFLIISKISPFFKKKKKI